MRFSDVVSQIPTDVWRLFLGEVEGADVPSVARWVEYVGRRELASRFGEVVHDLAPPAVTPDDLRPSVLWLDAVADRLEHEAQLINDKGLLPLVNLFRLVRGAVEPGAAEVRP